jgi:hypothetical protein
LFSWNPLVSLRNAAGWSPNCNQRVRQSLADGLSWDKSFLSSKCAGR